MTTKDIVIIILVVIFSPIIIPVLLLGALIVWLTTQQPDYDCDKGRHIYESNPIEGAPARCMLCGKT